MELTREHARLARRVAGSYAGRLAPGVDVDDLAQEALIAAWEALPRVNDERTAHAFIIRRMYGAMCDSIRRLDPLSRKHRDKIKAGHADDVTHERDLGVVAAMLADPETPETLLARRQDVEEVVRRVDRLPERQRAAIHHAVEAILSGRMLQDAAAALAMQPASFSNLLKRALESLAMSAA